MSSVCSLLGNPNTNLEKHVAGGQRLNGISCRVGRGGGRREAETLLQGSTLLLPSVAALGVLAVLFQEVGLQGGRSQDWVGFVEHVVSWAGVVRSIPGSLCGKTMWVSEDLISPKTTEAVEIVR